MRKKCFLFLLTGIPDQVNRAIYQRALYLSDKVNLHIFLGKNTNLSPKIKEKSNVYRFFFPSCIFKKLKLFGHLLEIFLFTLCIVIKLIPQKKLFIYTFHRNGFTAGGILKLLKGEKVKWIVDMQHTPYYYYDASKKKDLFFLKRAIYWILGYFYIILGKIFLPKADLVFAMSFDYDEGFAKILENEFGVPREKLVPIPNGVDLKIIAEAKSKKEKCQFNIPENKIKFLYAGNIWPERLKMLKQFINIFAKKANVEAVLTICGAMPLDTKKRFKNVKDDKLIYLGLIPHSELLKLYKEIDIVLVFIDPSMRDHNYSHPGKLFEAMAMGKIVVVSNFTTARRIIKDGYNGFILDDDFECTCNKLIKVINNIELRKRIENNAVKSIKFLDWNLLNKKWYLEIERKILKEV